MEDVHQPENESLTQGKAFIRAKSKNPMGRPTKFNDAIAEKIVNLIKAGNYLDVAAAACGIDRSTLRVWLKAGERSNKGKLHDFSIAVAAAMATAEAFDVQAVAKAVREGDWRAAAWRLERKHRKRWGLKTETTLKGSEKHPVAVGLQVQVIPARVVNKETGAPESAAGES